MKTKFLFTHTFLYLLCTLSLAYVCGCRKNTLQEIPVISNTGVRPVQILLRSENNKTVNFRTIMYIEMKAKGIDKTVSLGLYGTATLSPIDRNSQLHTFSVDRTDIFQNDLGNADKLAEAMRKIASKATYDRHGNVLHQEGTDTELVSRNFPDKPVHIGDTWTGWLGADKTHIISFRVDDIMNYHGRDLAKISYTYETSHNGMPQSHRREEWLGTKDDDISKSDYYDDIKSNNNIPATIHNICYTYPQR